MNDWTADTLEEIGAAEARQSAAPRLATTVASLQLRFGPQR